MTFSELIDETFAIVQDSNYFDSIPGYVNIALEQATTEVILPEFKHITTVDTITDTPYVSLLGTAGRKIGGIVKVFGTQYKVYATVEDMIDDLEITNITETGEVIEGLATEGTNLWYWPVPEVPITVMLMYYLSHPKLVLADDEVTLFPDSIQRLAICCGAAAMCFEKMEDGMDAEKVNTEANRALQRGGIQQLREYYARSKKHFISSVWSA